MGSSDGETTLGIDSDELGLFGYEDGILVGAAFSRDRDALSWGRSVFERTVEKSVQI